MKNVFALTRFPSIPILTYILERKPVLLIIWYIYNTNGTIHEINDRVEQISEFGTYVFVLIMFC